MKVFITVLVLIFSFQSWTKADDISDFQIEGMSIGDSLLDYYNLNEINRFQKINYPDKKYIFVNIFLKEKEYSSLQVGYKKGDENYIIELLNGVIRFNQEIENCYKKQEKIKEFIISNIEFLKENEPLVKEFLPKDSLNKVKTTQFNFILNNGNILLYCIDHPIENKKEDKLKLQMQTKNMSDYLLSQY